MRGQRNPNPLSSWSPEPTAPETGAGCRRHSDGWHASADAHHPPIGEPRCMFPTISSYSPDSMRRRARGRNPPNPLPPGSGGMHRVMPHQPVDSSPDACSHDLIIWPRKHEVSLLGPWRGPATTCIAGGLSSSMQIDAMHATQMNGGGHPRPKAGGLGQASGPIGRAYGPSGRLPEPCGRASASSGHASGRSGDLYG
ncbi:MAG: hypothetical protein HONBIEJF_02397 [Fimbriimonadaceae bacterium]|nr:hypothetical protein [Fimbriimonadaceae bacterium]